jgi:hypothetical protein
MADLFDFRGVPRESDAYQSAINNFVQSQYRQDALRTDTANKQMEIDALLARARINEEAADRRNAATNEANAAIHKANNDTQQLVHLVPKETVAAYNKTAGTNYPERDLPAQAFGALIQADKQAASDAVKERLWANRDATNLERTITSNERIAKAQIDAENRRIIAANNLDIHRQELEKAAEDRQRIATAQGNLNSRIKGALNIEPNKQGLNTAFDPGQAIVNNPQSVEDLIPQVIAAGGLPKGVPVTPIKPYAAYESPPYFSSIRPEAMKEYQQREQKFNTLGQQWRAAIAPPTTGSGGASMNKGVPKELVPTSPTPAATQLIPTPTPTPSNTGGFSSMVGAQPSLPAPGPSVGGPPSSSSVQPVQPRPTVIRVAPDGRRIEYDAITKQPLRVVQ